MPIGDVTDLIAHGTEAHLVVRATATLETPQDALDVERLWSGSWLEELSLDDSSKPRPGRKTSLKKLMEQRHAVTVVDGGNGPEAVSVPFAHVAIVTGEDLGGAQDAADQLSQLMSRAWGPHIDPDLGPRVRYLRGNLHGDNALSLFFGYGVHIPGERAAQGRIRVETLDEQGRTRSTYDLTLPNGSPAGLYPEQSGIAFSGDETRTAVSLPELPADVMFFLGTLPRVRPLDRPQVIWKTFGSAKKDNWACSETSARTDEGWDGSFKITKGQRLFARVDYMFDARLGRLWPALPAGPAFTVVGLALPRSFAGTPVRRWWVDVDAQNVLVTSAVMPRRMSLIVQDGKLKPYSWRDFGFDWDDPSGRATLDPKASFAGEPRTVMMAAKQRPFGFISCDGAGSFVFDAAAARGSRLHDLDWLAHALTLETEAKTIDGRTATSGETQVEFGGRNDAVKLRCRGQSLFRRDGSGEFRNVRDLELAPGEQAAIGPLIVEFRGG